MPDCMRLCRAQRSAGAKLFGLALICFYFCPLHTAPTKHRGLRNGKRLLAQQLKSCVDMTGLCVGVLTDRVKQCVLAPLCWSVNTQHTP